MIKLFGNEQKNFFQALNETEKDFPEEIRNKFIENAENDVIFAQYDNYDGYDTLFLAVPEILKDEASFKYLGVYITQEIAIIYEDWEDITHVCTFIEVISDKKYSAKKTLLHLLDTLTKNDFLLLGKMEDQLIDLEEELASDTITTGLKEISKLHRDLLPIKRFYEQLLEVLEDIQEDENGLYDESEEKFCDRIYNRVDKLYKTVLNLRDYITQVREAYQAQIDIGQNSIMKIFTVITAIFFFFFLLVGWYGMNLQMPEVNSPVGYPIVIIVSIIIVIGCIIFFKKKKWF
jgi:magnesium transporter